MKRAPFKHECPTDDDRRCDYCGELVPTRVIDNDGYAPNQLICEGCFWHEEASWDDLPEPKWPEEE